MLEINKVYNMDCIEGLKLIDNESVDLIITDPPYEVKYNEKSTALSNYQDSGYEKQKIRDASFKDQMPDYNIVAAELFRVLKKEAHCYIFCADTQIGKWQDVMTKAGFKMPQVLIWLKDNCTMDMTMGHKYIENKEIILFFHKGWKMLNGYEVERSKFRSVLEFERSMDTDFHGCAKPISLLMFLIKASSKENDLILDLFAGSGNHLIAAKRLNRRYLGFELSETYYQTIIKRLEFEKKQKKLCDMEDAINDKKTNES